MSSLEKAGWKCIAMHDPAGRRGVWYRTTPRDVRTDQKIQEPVGTIEMCAGREGDDAYVIIAVGTVMDERKMYDLLSLLEYGLYAREQSR